MSEFSGVWADVYQKGKTEAFKEMAINMLHEDTYSVETIAKLTQLSVEDIEKIRCETLS